MSLSHFSHSRRRYKNGSGYYLSRSFSKPRSKAETKDPARLTLLVVSAHGIACFLPYREGYYRVLRSSPSVKKFVRTFLISAQIFPS